MLNFQEPLLKHNLERLPREARVAFASCCAQRLANVYHRYLADSGQADRATTCDDALDYVWTHVLSSHDAATTARLLAQVMAMIPDQDAPGWTHLTAYAEDALSALAYCLRCLQSADAQEAAWAARRVYEALDYFVTTKLDVSPNAPGAEERVMSDPLVQAELERQARDLADLAAAGERIPQELLDRLRTLSSREQALEAS